jgi:tight adherence protein C
MTIWLSIASGMLWGIAAASVLAAWAARPAGRGAARRRRGTGGGERLGDLERLVRFARWAGPFARRWVPAPSDAVRRIDAAGLSPALWPSDLRALRGAAVVMGTALGLLLVPIVGGAGSVLAVAITLAAGLAPDLLLRHLAGRRGAAILRALPDTIDLLRIALRSGRSVPETLARVGAHHHGDLGRELRRAAAEIRLGVPVDVALEGLRRRCPAEGTAELVSLLRRAHRQGHAVGDGLRALADDLRERRARAAIDHAARAAPKIQLVVALLLVPAAMLLIAAALLPLLGGG